MVIPTYQESHGPDAVLFTFNNKNVGLLILLWELIPIQGSETNWSVIQVCWELLIEHYIESLSKYTGT